MTDDGRNGGWGRLAPLEKVGGYGVADGDPDIRAWRLTMSDGRPVGRVHDLIADTAALRVRYLDVELHVRGIGGREGRHVLIPVGVARLHAERDEVVVEVATALGMLAGPSYVHTRITRQHENAVRRVHGWDEPAIPSVSPDYYAHAHFDDRACWGTRRLGREHAPYLVRAAARG